jgi:hypothetical protein
MQAGIATPQEALITFIIPEQASYCMLERVAGCIASHAACGLILLQTSSICASSGQDFNLLTSFPNFELIT